MWQKSAVNSSWIWPWRGHSAKAVILAKAMLEADYEETRHLILSPVWPRKSVEILCWSIVGYALKCNFYTNLTTYHLPLYNLPLCNYGITQKSLCNSACTGTWPRMHFLDLQQLDHWRNGSVLGIRVPLLSIIGYVIIVILWQIFQFVHVSIWQSLIPMSCLCSRFPTWEYDIQCAVLVYTDDLKGDV